MRRSAVSKPEASTRKWSGPCGTLISRSGDRPSVIQEGAVFGEYGEYEIVAPSGLVVNESFLEICGQYSANTGSFGMCGSARRATT